MDTGQERCESFSDWAIIQHQNCGANIMLLSVVHLLQYALPLQAEVKSENTC